MCALTPLGNDEQRDRDVGDLLVEVVAALGLDLARASRPAARG